MPLPGTTWWKSAARRPTTRQPVLICRSGLEPHSLGIDPESVRVVQRDLPNLANLVLIDCPDPDTSEAGEAEAGNLARLRRILPRCDVLLVVATQQKYRSARVAEELTSAASGAQLVFVESHADTDQDIREDWRRVLEGQYAPGRIFFVDALAALRDAQEGLEPRGEFAALVDLLTRQLAGAAAARLRRANLLDLADETLATCSQRLGEGAEAVERLQEAIEEHRLRLAGQLSAQMRGELLASRRPWENRLLGQVAARWGFSPFALVLRAYQGLGGLVSGALLLRARTPAQVALWGAMEGARTWQKHRQNRQTAAASARLSAATWETAELHGSALVMEGFAAEAGLERQAARPENIASEAAEAAQAFVTRVGTEIEGLLARLAQRHTGWFTRWRYELLLLVMLAVLLARPAKNFFYDSWLAAEPAPLLGLSFYVLSAFWFTVWCVVLLWSFTSRLRRGLRREIDRLAEGWNRPGAVDGVFSALERQCAEVAAFRHELERLREHLAGLRRRLASPEEPLGHRRP